MLTYTFWQNHFQGDRGVLGKVVQLNKRPFTIIGIARPSFHGTLLFFNPDFFVPLVNDEQVQGVNVLNKRNKTAVFMTLGHLKAGVTPAQAVADLNSVGAYLEKTYPKDDGKLTITLGRPNLYGDYIGRPARIFMTGLMMLAGLILLAACANLGSLFAARAADRSREVALRLALGSSRRRILRGLFTEAVLISLAGGTAGLLGSVMLLRALSTWQPFPRWPIHLEVTPDAKVYAVALLLTLVERIPLWRRPRKAGARHQSLRSDQVGPYRNAGRPGQAAADTPRRPARRADCHLWRVGDFLRWSPSAD